MLRLPSKSAVLSTSSRLFRESSADCLGEADVSSVSPFELAVTALLSGVLFESAVTAGSLAKGASDDIAMIETGGWSRVGAAL